MTREGALEFIAQSIKSDVDMAKVADAIKAIEQEPFINKPCVSSGVCEHDKQKVLDKIRAEIEQRPYGIANDSVIQGMKYERVAILEILDKYKAESEEYNEDRRNH